MERIATVVGLVGLLLILSTNYLFPAVNYEGVFTHTFLPVIGSIMAIGCGLYLLVSAVSEYAS